MNLIGLKPNMRCVVCHCKVCMQRICRVQEIKCSEFEPTQKIIRNFMAHGVDENEPIF